MSEACARARVPSERRAAGQRVSTRQPAEGLLFRAVLDRAPAARKAPPRSEEYTRPRGPSTVHARRARAPELGCGKQAGHADERTIAVGAAPMSLWIAPSRSALLERSPRAAVGCETTAP